MHLKQISRLSNRKDRLALKQFFRPGAKMTLDRVLTPTERRRFIRKCRRAQRWSRASLPKICFVIDTRIIPCSVTDARYEHKVFRAELMVRADGALYSFELYGLVAGRPPLITLGDPDHYGRHPSEFAEAVNVLRHMPTLQSPVPGGAVLTLVPSREAPTASWEDLRAWINNGP